MAAAHIQKAGLGSFESPVRESAASIDSRGLRLIKTAAGCS
jgi:hypothetical protein